MTYQEAEGLLRKTQVHTHIDFRLRSEINIDKPNYFFQFDRKVHHLAIDTQDDEFSKILLPSASQWAEFYIRVLKRNMSQVLLFLKIIADGVNDVFSFGCSAGKDRTGIISAILLSLLEVGDSQIIEDYCLSNAGLHDHLHYFEDSKKELGRTREEFLDKFLTVSEETMRLFLNYLKTQEGGVIQLLISAGLPLNIIEQLKLNLSEKNTQ